jgi:hypothetical protein
MPRVQQHLDFVALEHSQHPPPSPHPDAERRMGPREYLTPPTTIGGARIFGTRTRHRRPTALGVHLSLTEGANSQ